MSAALIDSMLDALMADTSWCDDFGEDTLRQTAKRVAAICAPLAAVPPDIHSARFLSGCTTSLTIDNLPVAHVGTVLEILKDAGIGIEINAALEPKI